MAMGCSTNAIVHLVAMSRRAGCAVGLEDFDAASRKVPVIANIRPSGDTYLMEDFYYAGGLPALMNRLARHLDLSAMTVNGKSLGENIEGRSEEHTSELQSLMRISYAVFCLNKKTQQNNTQHIP